MGTRRTQERTEKFRDFHRKNEFEENFSETRPVKKFNGSVIVIRFFVNLCHVHSLCIDCRILRTLVRILIRLKNNGNIAVLRRRDFCIET